MNGIVEQPGRRLDRDVLVPIRHLLHTGRDPLLLGVAVVFPRVTGLLTLPFYARLLGPEDFGRYELLSSIMALAYAVCVLGLDFAMSVRFYALDEVARRRDASSALATAAATSLIVATVLLLLAGAIGPPLLQSSSAVLPFAIVVVAVPFNVSGGVLAMYLRLRFRGSAFFRAMFGGALGGTVIGLTLVVGAGWGLVGASIGLAAVHVMSCALLAFGARGSLALRDADGRTALRLVRLGAPLVPAGAASWVFALADRFFVAAFLGFAQLGLYAAAARLTAILFLIQYGFHAAWGPIALRWGTLADRDRRYAVSLRLVAIAGGAAIAIVSWLAGPLLWLLAGPSYVGAANVVWLLAASALFLAMFSVVQIGANLAQRGKRVASALIAAAIINTIANLALIPTLGYVGAGVATLGTYSIAYGIMFAMSQGVTRIAMRFGRSTCWAIGWTAVAASSVLAPSGIRPAADIIVVATATAFGLAIVVQTAGIFSGAGTNSNDGVGPEMESARGGPTAF